MTLIIGTKGSQKPIWFPVSNYNQSVAKRYMEVCIVMHNLKITKFDFVYF